MPDQPAITDQTVQAYIAASNAAYRHMAGPEGEIRAGLAAAAPHIAAQALRDAAKTFGATAEHINAEIKSGDRDGIDRHFSAGCHAAAARLETRAAKLADRGIAALDAQHEIQTHAKLEGCERCCGPIGEVEDIRQCPAVREWGRTIAAFHELAGRLGSPAPTRTEQAVAQCDQSVRPEPAHRCAQPMGHAGLHRSASGFAWVGPDAEPTTRTEAKPPPDTSWVQTTDPDPRPHCDGTQACPTCGSGL